ncbi:MAG TPA: SDR family NAD(P)-dependent oxidoreductase [Candidatus Sulfotelmatobacter sp.]|jgi:NAD(P)-dependent dehydrogenase (short-subunit alcohol dehydrogenase family)|nr:SDR family NAD(P)-dependent oxidoreductase [Candidatus Sulfotelmatobacter sp.]
MTARTALVTGATGGLGTSVTKTLLDAGFTVVGLAPKVHPHDFDHPHFTAIPATLDSLPAAKQAVDTILAHFGKIDVLAHLVGGFTGGQTIADTDDATFKRMLDMNLMSAFHILRAVLPPMRQAGSGRIIAIGSRAAESPGAMVGAYSASKAALVSLIRTVAIESKDLGITANVILPGTIDTPANRKDMPAADTSQWVQPISIASLIVWLAGDGGKDVTGAAIPVYGRGL